jgi:tetratricopeptide (TPR) repeat protein
MSSAMAIIKRLSALFPALLICCTILLTDLRAQTQPEKILSTLMEVREKLNQGEVATAQEKIKSLMPSDDPRVLQLLGVALYSAGDLVNAIQTLTPVLDKLPEDSALRREAVQILGRSHFVLGHLPESVLYLEQAVAAQPDNAELTYALGMATIQTRQPEKARKAFARMFRVSPESAAAHLLTAQMMIRVEFEEFAEAELKKALEKEPRLPQANYLLGQMAIYKGRLDDGIALMEKELVTNPGNANAYYKLGDAYTRQLRWDDAITPLQKSIWINPWFSGPYILLGKCYLKKKQLPNAEGMLRRAIQYDPNNKSAHYLLGQVYQQMGKAEDAKREFSISEKLQGNPEQPER